MKVNRCMSCMKELDGEGACPHCGFDPAAYTAGAHQLPPGSVLGGKYMVGRAIGEGGFGITYVAWDINLEIKVAVKEFYPDGFVTRNGSETRSVTVLARRGKDFYEKGQERFVDEARRLAKFAGMPGIVGVKDYFQENNTAYIVMEYVEGETLKSVLKKQPHSRMDADVVFAMMEPVMDSLEIVHEAGMIHRDISPDNLMVDDRGKVKLLDFGAARAFVADGQKSLSVMLKPGYTPEEQYRSRGSQGPWTDVYALCATMYRAITGQMPPESLDRMGQDELKCPSELGVSISPAQEATLIKGLAVYKKDRLQNIGEMRAMLKTGGSGTNLGNGNSGSTSTGTVVSSAGNPEISVQMEMSPHQGLASDSASQSDNAARWTGADVPIQQADPQGTVFREAPVENAAPASASNSNVGVSGTSPAGSLAESQGAAKKSEIPWGKIILAVVIVVLVVVFLQGK